jgi:hypothetical protein
MWYVIDNIDSRAMFVSINNLKRNEGSQTKYYYSIFQ